MDYDFTYTGAEIQAILDTGKKLKDSGYIFLGVATPSTNPGTPTQKVYYEAKQAGTYTNFGGVVLPDGISLLIWNGSWTSETVMCGDGGVFDISVYKSSGGTLATFADLAAALNGGNNIPVGVRKGGMSVKFVQSSDNKYVQYRLMSDSWSTDVTDWQGEENKIDAMSDNLVKGGGVFDFINKDTLISFVAGKNLLNKDYAVLGKYVGYQDGNVRILNSYCFVLCNVKSETDYTIDGSGIRASHIQVAFFNNNAYIDGSASSKTVTTPANCNIMAVSFPISKIDVIQVEEGTSATDYEPYKRYLKGSCLQSQSVDKSKMSIAVQQKLENSAQKEVGKNKFNKNDVVEGKYINYTTGLPGTLSNYEYGYITCKPNTDYVISGSGLNGNNMHIAYYDFNGNYISGELSITPHTPANCYKFSVSIPIANNDTCQVEEGSVATPYEAYHVRINPSLIGIKTISKDKLTDELQSQIDSAVHLVVGKNLFNKVEALSNSGYYINISTGERGVIPSYNYVFIDVEPNTDYTVSGQSSAGNTLVAYFNGETFISGETTLSIHTPNNCNRMAVSIAISNDDACQVEKGSVATSYQPYGKFININQIEDNSITKEKLSPDVVEKKYIVDINGSGDFTSILEALETCGENVTLEIASGTYDIEAEYKAKYGNTYFDDYLDGDGERYNNFINGMADTGLYLRKGVKLIGKGTVVVKFLWSGTNTGVKTYFAMFNTTFDNVIKNIRIVAGVANCRYHIHDDWCSNSAQKCGTNIFEDLVFNGTSNNGCCLGAGMGLANTYIVKNCMFLSNDNYSISYHNSQASGADNTLIIDACYCNGINYRPYGSSTIQTYVYISNCRATKIERLPMEGGNNMTLIEWNNQIDS